MKTRIALLIGATVAFAGEPVTELLYPQGAPGALGATDLDKPSLTIYLTDPAKASETAVIVCPGGGYGALAMGHEGKDIANWLNGIGISAFVLKYRLGPRYRHPIPLNDVSQAFKIVRSRAKEFRIEPGKIGVWGFSAGGHLASTISTHFTADTRPDFAILCYPVITFYDDYAHKGSRRNLLGETPEPKLVEDLSNHLHVTSRTPPTFIFHTDADTSVPPENSVQYYLALRKAKVPAEIHIFQNGPHGLGLASNDPAASAWPALLKNWLKVRGLIQ